MSLTEERMRILNMIEAGTITASEGATLLAALDRQDDKAGQQDAAGRARWMHIRVTDLETGQVRVSVDLPVGLVGVGAKLGARYIPETDALSLEDLVRSVQEGAYGKVADVQDDENGERVEVYID